MKKIIQTTHSIFVYIGFTIFIHSNDVFGQEITKSYLYQKWTLEKYQQEGDYYTPSQSEINDFLLLKQDMTFEATTEGEFYSGGWMLNTNGTYIELKYSSGEREKLRIKFLTTTTLVVTYDLDYYRYTEVHYVSCK